jgi:hypothetical protein
MLQRKLASAARLQPPAGPGQQQWQRVAVVKIDVAITGAQGNSAAANGAET